MWIMRDEANRARRTMLVVARSCQEYACEEKEGFLLFLREVIVHKMMGYRTTHLVNYKILVLNENKRQKTDDFEDVRARC